MSEGDDLGTKRTIALNDGSIIELSMSRRFEELVRSKRGVPASARLDDDVLRSFLEEVVRSTLVNMGDS
jgi:hypothetical protein